MDGVLVIDKPVGLTSHDVVASVKRKLKARKVGHLGTLDPCASGVLVLVVNRATKSAVRLAVGPKVYVATLKLGQETDTFDGEGAVVRTAPTGSLKPGDVAGVLTGFVGTARQLPPMYSAVKRHGTPLYKLARKGIEVDRAPKPVEIFDVEVFNMALPYVVFRVECSGGTYLRTICHEAGEKLGCGGHLVRLQRTVSGSFSLKDALGLDATPETMGRRLIGLGAALERVGNKSADKDKKGMMQHAG